MRKKIIFLFCLLPNLLFSQQGINLSFNVVHAGKNLALKYSKQITPKKEILFGLKYHLNPNPVKYFDNNYTYKAIYAFNIGQHLGPNFTYYYGEISSKNRAKFRFFYDLQYTYAGTRNLYYFYSKNPDPNSKDAIYRKLLKDKRPIHMLEQNIGINFKLPLTDKYNLLLSLGSGIVFFADKFNHFKAPNYELDWEFNPVYVSVGITQLINKKTVKK